MRVLLRRRCGARRGELVGIGEIACGALTVIAAAYYRPLG